MGLGEEVVFRVFSTPKGCKVTQYDGRGLAEGLGTKSNYRYFYGEDAPERAARYAETHAAKYDSGRVVALGERF